MIAWWFFGLVLAWIWIDRLRDSRNIRRVPDITMPEWAEQAFETANRQPKAGNPKVSIIVPARNEAAHVEAALRS
ncbi:MAG: hypothetical protein ACXVZZ_07700, partial [Terriglobales bacterium]